MPVQNTTAGGLFKKLGGNLQKSFNANKNNEYTPGQVDLPAGISNGIAQVTMCKFGVYKEGDYKGEYFFMASATVLAPKEHEGIPIEGQRTSIGPEPVCNTPKSNGKRKTLDDHIRWVINQLQGMGVDTSSLEAKDLEAAAAQVQEEKPTIRFRTWKGKPTKDFPNPRVNHEWNGLVEFTPEDAGDPTARTQDDSGGNDSSGDTTSAEEYVEAENAEDAENSGSSETGEDTVDIDQLVTDAENDGDAQQKLKDLAISVGKTEKEINKAKDWAEVGEWVKEAQGSAEGEAPEEAPTEEEAAEFVPQKGEVYKTKLKSKDPRTKKDIIKVVQVEVLTVNEAKKTVDVKRYDTKATEKGIKFDALESSD